jgi:hypothetical protein
MLTEGFKDVSQRPESGTGAGIRHTQPQRPMGSLLPSHSTASVRIRLLRETIESAYVEAH